MGSLLLIVGYEVFLYSKVIYHQILKTNNTTHKINCKGNFKIEISRNTFFSKKWESVPQAKKKYLCFRRSGRVKLFFP